MVFATFRPLEVSHFRSRDAAAAVLLASSLNWTINQQHNGPVSLVAEDGKQIRVPDNTGIKMDIFRSWIHQIATHSSGSISRKLIDDIVKTTKLGREHARLMYDLAEDDIGPDDFGPVEKPEVPEEKPLLPQGSYSAEAFVVSREVIEPYHDNPEYAWKRTWSDGHVDYECMHCGRLFDSVKGVGAHQQFHIRRGQVEGKKIKGRPGAPETRRRFIPPDEPLHVTKRGQALPRTDEVKMIEVSEQVITDALSAMKQLEQIRALLGADEVSALKEELAAKEARIKQLEGNLQALRDLLSGDI